MPWISGPSIAGVPRTQATIVAGGCFVASLALGLSVGLAMPRSSPSFFSNDFSFEELVAAEKQMQAKLVVADDLWDKDKKPEALTIYKAIVRDVKSEDKQRVYRRIIEHSLEYGDPGEARDWMMKALGDNYAGSMSMDSPKGKALLEDVRKDIATEVEAKKHLKERLHGS